MFEDDFLETFVDQITWERFTGHDENGMPSYAAPKTLQCRISPKQRQIQDPHGAVMVSNATIYLTADISITADDRITLPDGEDPPILRVAKPPDTDGTHHTTVMI